MDSTTDWDAQLKEIEGIAGERRYDRRYGIELDLHWKLIRRRRVLDSGRGHTIDLSSGGVLIDAGRLLPVGLNLELSIVWPVLLRDVAPLQLIVSGRIVRSAGTHCGVAMAQHEFRTIGVSFDGRQPQAQAKYPPAAFLAGTASTPTFGKR